MSVSKWAYAPGKCDGGPCPGDCDGCGKREVSCETCRFRELEPWQEPCDTCTDVICDPTNWRERD